jgi:hypothetical protein
MLAFLAITRIYCDVQQKSQISDSGAALQTPEILRPVHQGDLDWICECAKTNLVSFVPHYKVGSRSQEIQERSSAENIALFASQIGGIPKVLPSGTVAIAPIYSPYLAPQQLHLDVEHYYLLDELTLPKIFSRPGYDFGRGIQLKELHWNPKTTPEEKGALLRFIAREMKNHPDAILRLRIGFIIEVWNGTERILWIELDRLHHPHRSDPPYWGSVPEKGATPILRKPTSFGGKPQENWRRWSKSLMLHSGIYPLQQLVDMINAVGADCPLVVDRRDRLFPLFVCGGEYIIGDLLEAMEFAGSLILRTFPSAVIILFDRDRERQMLHKARDAAMPAMWKELVENTVGIASTRNDAAPFSPEDFLCFRTAAFDELANDQKEFITKCLEKNGLLPSVKEADRLWLHFLPCSEVEVLDERGRELAGLQLFGELFNREMPQLR